MISRREVLAGAASVAAAAVLPKQVAARPIIGVDPGAGDMSMVAKVELTKDGYRVVEILIDGVWRRIGDVKLMKFPTNDRCQIGRIAQ